ncbi:hypothetical protein [Candidatus Laterigemmans baculatus]|uniref:hypothetical protein n=1 Tax=Candidatus Laterigemmans baculatus TaxID=2770505 RepID=UPI0013DA80C5|nr:hypothetical protein [Candidatus Laterigemmans baculatus]
MATTASHHESAMIRERMRSIRNTLPARMYEARSEVRQMTDWKHQAGKHPWLVFGAVAAAGYFVVPYKRPKAESATLSMAQLEDGTPVAIRETPGKTTAKASLASMLVSTITTFALRTGTGLLAQKLSQRFDPEMRFGR